jgi:uncharacterized RDD family membrane protein YckC
VLFVTFGDEFGEIIIDLIMTFISICIVAVYNVIMLHKYQATVGKMAIGAKVLAEDGTRLSLKQIILRETIYKFLSGIIFLIGYIMAGFTQRKQALHDILAHSIVVYKDQTKGPNKIAVGIIFGMYAMIIIMSILVIFFFVFIMAMIGASAM